MIRITVAIITSMIEIWPKINKAGANKADMNGT